LKDVLVDAFYDSQDEMLLLMNMLENAYSRFLERGFVFSGIQPMQNIITEGQKNQLLNYSKNINQTSKDKLNSKLINGGNPKEIIESLYDDFKNRSPLIAETTAVSAFNAGLWVGYRTQGYKYKIWVSQRDDRVRHSHFVADSQKVGIDEMFIVGSQQLMYPGDPTASPEEVINCRCTLIGEK